MDRADGRDIRWQGFTDREAALEAAGLRRACRAAGFVCALLGEPWDQGEGPPAWRAGQPIIRFSILTRGPLNLSCAQVPALVDQGRVR
jgi:hypothetical protein